MMNGFFMGNQMTKEIIANCSCGKVSFKTTSEPILQLACHCADCREASGDDFSTIVFFKADKVETTGDLHSADFISDNGNKTARLACANCNNAIFDKSEAFANMFGVLAKHIQPPFVAKPQMHVWTASKLPHVKLPDNVKAYEKGLG